jgi:hypothetical protein
MLRAGVAEGVDGQLGNQQHHRVAQLPLHADQGVGDEPSGAGH